MAESESTKLNWSLDDLFLYLLHATICISDKAKQEVYNGMAKKLIEWNHTSPSELRKTFQKYDIEFEELCIHCNEPMPDWDVEADGEPECNECKSEPHQS